MWYARAITETMQSTRTWFGTITLHPDAVHQGLIRARRQSARAGLIWEEMTPHEQFRELHKQNGLELQLWLKRVRKQSKATFRFLLVAEAHKSGLPHYHCLIHEQDGGGVVRHAVLSQQWTKGFTNFKLVTDAKQAGYLCKYLSKSALARVRASKLYGQKETLCSDRFHETVNTENHRQVISHDTPRKEPDLPPNGTECLEWISMPLDKGPSSMGAIEGEEADGLPSSEITR